MIVTEQKSFEEILEMLEGYKNLILVGCGGCATKCLTGGKEQIQEMKQKLELQDKKIIKTIFIDDAVCDQRFIRLEYLENREFFEKADVIQVFACGVGAQTVSDLIGDQILVYSGVNTRFSGSMERMGLYFERCSACGECILHLTGGICPVSRCAKGLLNGPCGGSKDGKCEITNSKIIESKGYDVDCAWYLIYERLKKFGKLDNLKKIFPAKDWTDDQKPQQIVRDLLIEFIEANSE